MPCGQAPSPQQRAGEAASESHVTADAISQQGGDNYALRASSIQPASSLRGSTPAQSQHRLCHLLELISRAPFGFWEIPTVVRGGPLGPMGPRKAQVIAGGKPGYAPLTALIAKALAPLPSCTSTACPSFFGLLGHSTLASKRPFLLQRIRAKRPPPKRPHALSGHARL